MRVLITGITGFVGRHLVASLAQEDRYDLHGTTRVDKPADLPAGTPPQASLPAQLHEVLLEDVPTTSRWLAELKPDWIFHLAGYANAGKAYREPWLCLRDNLHLTLHFYEAIQASGLKPRVLLTSTGLIYGDQPQDAALNESQALAPVGPYAAAKAATDLYSYQVFRTTGLPILRVRLFNQMGPGQSADYATANFAKQIAEIEAGLREPKLRTGDLRAYRDLTDIRDMVRALRLLMERGEPGEAYNAGSGEAVQIQTVLQELLKLSRVPIRVETELDPHRPAETAILRADIRKLQAATGWSPTIPRTETLQDLLNFWRARSQPAGTTTPAASVGDGSP